MSKEKLGLKRLCESCGAKFYDLQRDPITCPKCEAVYIVATKAPSAPSKASNQVAEDAPELADGEKDKESDEDDLSDDNTVSFDELIDDEDKDDSESDDADMDDFEDPDFDDDIDDDIDDDSDITLLEDDD